MVTLKAPPGIQAVEYAGEVYPVTDKGYVRVPRIIQDDLTRCTREHGPGFQFPEAPTLKYSAPKIVAAPVPEVARQILHASKKRG